MSKQTSDARYYRRHRADIRKRRLTTIAAGHCPIHPSSALASKTKCAKCLLETRISYLRAQGLCDYELQRARDAVATFAGRCQCCGGTQDGLGAGAGKDFALEHNHVTKKFRGIVCAACNLAIGHAKENIERLRSIIQYLGREIL